ncbi:DUF5666 domain-containing protein [Phyllobacterium endophyticum]|uniref:DUF5666 domain-containing protein n=1 Tax=Phyllobacterium endophyticum TaxID=1149773 RepID=UPI0011CBAD5D|nr:DUF5666 domain-containing protein [Phyllobacterium endophyticum]TXR48411.1 hypothetical protein FVA77_15235 [Phyllobacterium endophyticum]
MHITFKRQQLLALALGTAGAIALTLPANAQSTMMQSSKPLAGVQASGHVNIRGVITSLAGKSLVVRTREGGDATVILNDDCLINSVTPASVKDIKPGDFVGISNVPKADGVSSALEVVIFPAALKGTGEGDRPWDLRPNSSMTNATVANAVTSVDGRTVMVTYRGGQKKIDIPETTPIVTLEVAAPKDLRAGTNVFIAADHANDGTLTTHRVIYGSNGVVPPM